MSRIEERPLVTFALFAYNQEKFIRKAVEAALNQDYQRLEIILSDDCSTDSTFEIINSIASNYSGIHEIIINRNPINLGLAKHFNEIVARARGEIIIVAAGDDISLSTRASKTVEIFIFNPNATIVSFTDKIIDKNDKEQKNPGKKEPKIIRKITLKNYIDGDSPSLSGASRGFKKIIFDIFGDLNHKCPTEDTPYILRGLMIGDALISPECGILYRQHDNNLSGPASLHSMKFEEIKKQYMIDAEVAISNGLITKNSIFNIKKWVDRNHRRRKLFSEIYYENKKIKFFIYKIFLNNDFKLREKISIFFNSLRKI